jgi:sugar/nucleoside kinase (ribokinase family)
MKNERDLDVIVAGEANVDLMMLGVPRVEFDKELLAQDMSLVLGGSSSIAAFNLARLGARVGFVGFLGRDTFGDFVEERLRWAGVDVSQVRRVRQPKTGITIWHEYKGRRAGVTYQGCIAKLRGSDIRSSYLRRAKHLHIGAYFFQENLHHGAAAAFRRAHKLGLTTSLDCNYDPKETWDSGIFKVLRETDIFLPNETEALRLTGCRTVAEAASVLTNSARIVAIKRGARGALVKSPEATFSVKALKCKVVDTTGAGDSFNAGFLAEFVKGKSIEECARSAVRAGARAVSAVGGTTAFE